MFRQITPRQIPANPLDMIADGWLLLTAGAENYNTMTASWGGVMRIWNEDCLAVFVRPQRYTFEFMEQNDFFTACFFDELYRPALSFCGSNSGRDCDKASETGLCAVTENGYTYFRQADLVIICRKIYSSDFIPERFADSDLAGRFYPGGDYHRMYIGQMKKILLKE